MTAAYTGQSARARDGTHQVIVLRDARDPAFSNGSQSRHPWSVRRRAPLLSLALMVVAGAVACSDDSWFTGKLVNDTSQPVVVLESCPTYKAANSDNVAGWKFDTKPLARLVPGAAQPVALGNSRGNLPLLVTAPDGTPDRPPSASVHGNPG